MANPFFKNFGPTNIKDIYKVLKIKIDSDTRNIKIFDIADLNSASDKDITFLLVDCVIMQIQQLDAI